MGDSRGGLYREGGGGTFEDLRQGVNIKFIKKGKEVKRIRREESAILLEG